MSYKPIKLSFDEHISINELLIEYLRNIYDNEIEVTDNLGKTVKKTTLKEIYYSWFINKDLNPDFVHIKVLNSEFLEIFRKINVFIQNKLNIDQCLFEKFKNSYTPVWKWIILGSRASYSKKHRDMYGTSSWNYLIFGSKKWTLYLPSDKKSSEKIIHFQQEPGDIIWIPENIYHEVEYLKESICLSQNLILERFESEIIDNILKVDCYESNFLKALKYLKSKGQ